MIATGYIECNKAGAVALIVIAVGLSGISMAGWAVNHLDLAPPYAGIPLRSNRGRIIHALHFVCQSVRPSVCHLHIK